MKTADWKVVLMFTPCESTKHLSCLQINSILQVGLTSCSRDLHSNRGSSHRMAEWPWRNQTSDNILFLVEIMILKPRLSPKALHRELSKPLTNVKSMGRAKLLNLMEVMQTNLERWDKRCHCRLTTVWKSRFLLLYPCMLVAYCYGIPGL